MPLFSSKGVPPCCNSVVLGDTIPFAVHLTQCSLSTCIPLVGSKGVPLECNVEVLWDTESFIVENTQIELGNGMPTFCKRSELTQSCCIVARQKSIESLLVISTRAGAHTTGKQCEGQAEGTNQFFHWDNLRPNIRNEKFLVELFSTKKGNLEGLDFLVHARLPHPDGLDVDIRSIRSSNH